MCQSLLQIYNNALVELHPIFCFVKDQVSKVVPMKGYLHNGLYIFDKSHGSIFFTVLGVTFLIKYEAGSEYSVFRVLNDQL